MYNSAVAIAVSTTASKNKGVLIVNTAGGATEADIFFCKPDGSTSTEVVIKALVSHDPIFIPIRFFKTGGTQTNCTVYEVT